MKRQSIDAAVGRAGGAHSDLEGELNERLNTARALLKDRTPDISVRPKFEAPALGQPLRGVETRESLERGNSNAFAANLMKGLKGVKLNGGPMLQANIDHYGFNHFEAVWRTLPLAVVIAGIVVALSTVALFVNHAIAFWF